MNKRYFTKALKILAFTLTCSERAWIAVTLPTNIVNKSQREKGQRRHSPRICKRCWGGAIKPSWSLRFSGWQWGCGRLTGWLILWWAIWGVKIFLQRRTRNQFWFSLFNKKTNKSCLWYHCLWGICRGSNCPVVAAEFLKTMDLYAEGGKTDVLC